MDDDEKNAEAIMQAIVTETVFPPAKATGRQPYLGKWETFAQAAGGPMMLATKMQVSYVTMRKIMRLNKGSQRQVQRVQALAAELNVESPL